MGSVLVLGSGRWGGGLGQMVEALLPGPPQVVQEQSGSSESSGDADDGDDDDAKAGRTTDGLLSDADAEHFDLEPEVVADVDLVKS